VVPFALGVAQVRGELRAGFSMSPGSRWDEREKPLGRVALGVFLLVGSRFTIPAFQSTSAQACYQLLAIYIPPTGR
jgi:hypothetical protein